MKLIVMLSFILFGFMAYIRANSGCDHIVPGQNVRTTCTYQNISCDSTEPFLPGTQIEYSCLLHYIPLDQKHYRRNKKEGRRKIYCESNGSWTNYAHFQNFRCKEECGKVWTNAKPFILRGSSTPQNKWPWHAALFKKRNDSWIYICGGSIIRRHMILTAAHCVVTCSSCRDGDDPAEFRIVLGADYSDYIKNLESPDSRIHKVYRIYISEHYDPMLQLQGDLAILQLEDSIEYSSTILPVCIPIDVTQNINSLKSGLFGQVIGFGVTELGLPSPTLKEIVLQVKSNRECNSALRRVLTESQFCAGNNKNGSWGTACNGDSGGGFFKFSEVDAKYYIYGLVSSGDNRQPACQNYAVFTRIYSFLSWIRDAIEESTQQIAKDLQERVSFPFVLRGRENKFKRYSGFPREWEHRVTSIDLSHVEIDPEVFFDSLEVAPTLESIKLTSVKFLSRNMSRRRVVLPNLNEFSIDLLKTLNDSSVLQITSELLHQLLFFDQKYHESSANIFGNVGRIDLILNFYRILHVSKEELFVNRVSNCSTVLKNYYNNPDFNLKKLAISDCKFDFQDIENPYALTSLNFHKVDIENLELQKLVSLNSLVVPLDAVDLIIDLRTLSENLSHLCLFNAIDGPDFADEGMNPVENFTKGKIILQNIQAKLDQLKFFCCISCQLTQTFLEQILTFPKLVYFFLQTSASAAFLNFSKIEAVSSVQGPGSYLFHRNNTKFKFNLLKLTSEITVHQIRFRCQEGSKFWTSPEEKLLGQRLKSFEIKALNTNRFELIGETRAGEIDVVTQIPLPLQSKLVSIHLENVEVPPNILANSVANCIKLKILSVYNISLGKGITGNKELLKKSIKYEIRTVKTFPAFKYVREEVNGELISVSIPFQNVGKFKTESNTFHRLFSDVSSVQLRNNSAFVFSYNVTMGEVFGSVEYILHLLKNLPENQELKIMSPPLFELYELSSLAKKFLPPDWNFQGFSLFQRSLFRVGTIAKEYPIVNWFIQNIGRFGYNRKEIGKRIMALGNPFSGSSPRQIAVFSKSLPQIVAVNLLDEDYNI